MIRVPISAFLRADVVRLDPGFDHVLEISVIKLVFAVNNMSQYHMTMSEYIESLLYHKIIHYDRLKLVT